MCSKGAAAIRAQSVAAFGDSFELNGLGSAWKERRIRMGQRNCNRQEEVKSVEVDSDTL